MSNTLKMATKETILTLHEQGMSCREIGRRLDIYRDTVRKYVKEGNSKPAKVTTGSEVKEGSKSATVSTGKFAQKSLCTPYHESIEKGLEKQLSGQRIWQDLRDDEGFTGSYESVKRYVKSLGESTEFPFRRMETDPGEEAQVDFGLGSWIVDPQDSNKRRRSWVFRVILSHSRKGYSEAVFKQDTENFIRCLENAFWYFGGVPKRIVPDNLKAAVIKADWHDPEMNPKIESFARHYGTVFLPTRPYTPRHKGKVEGGVKYVKNNALKGRTFLSLQEENEFLRHWESQVADLRIHGTIKKQVRKIYEENERPALGGLKPIRFPFFFEGQRSVHRDGHVAVGNSFYSVPPEYLRRKVWVRWDARTVRVRNSQGVLIATHIRQEPGRFSTNDSHIPLEKRSKIEKGEDYLVDRARLIGSGAHAWAEAALKSRGIQGLRALQGLLSLANKHRGSALDRACQLAHNQGGYRLKSVRALIQTGDEQTQFEFIETHPLIRDMEIYGKHIETMAEKGT